MTVSLWRNILLPRGVVLLAWWTANQIIQLPLWMLWGLIATDILVFLFFGRRHVGIAEDHQRSSGAMAPVWGGYLLLFLAALASVTLWWDAILISQRVPPERSYAQEREHQRQASYSLTQVDTGLVFEGEITFGLIKRLQDHLSQDPQITHLQLSSPGGHIYEARGAAQLVLRHGLDTRASGTCASACTLLFAAGRTRQLLPGAELGFHGYSLRVFGGLPQVDPQAEQDKDLGFLVAQGVNEDFARKAFSTPSTDLWIPTPRELKDAGVITPTED